MPRGILAVLVVVGIVSPLRAAAPPVVSVISDQKLTLTAVRDVRWLEDGKAALAVPEQGIAVLEPLSPRSELAWLPEWQRPAAPGTRPIHLGVSSSTIVAGDTVFMAQWHTRTEHGSGMLGAEYIADLDIDGDRLLISGLRRDTKGQLGTDGSTAWLGTLSGGEESLRPVLPFHDRKEIEYCAGFGLGVVRFLAGGAFIIVPGTEPDIFLFDSTARLRRTWHTDSLGVDAQCGLSAEQRVRLSVDPPGREAWVNRKATIDDAVDTPDGPAVIIRARMDGKTVWDVALLNSDNPKRVRLPFTSPSQWAHLSADSRGRRLLFLVGDRTSRYHDSPPARVIVAEWGGR